MKRVKTLSANDSITVDFFNSLVGAVVELQNLSIEKVSSPLKKLGTNLTIEGLSPYYFYAKLTGESNGEYSWEESVLDGDGAWETLEGGRTGSLSVDPAKEFSGAKRLYRANRSTYVLMFLMADGDSEPRYRFITSKPAGATIPTPEGGQLLDLRRRLVGDVPNAGFAGPCYIEPVDGDGAFIATDYRGRHCKMNLGTYQFGQVGEDIDPDEVSDWGDASIEWWKGADWDAEDDELLGTFTFDATVSELIVYMEAGTGRLYVTLENHDNGNPPIHLWFSIAGGEYLTDDDEDAACPTYWDPCDATGTGTLTSDGAGACAFSGTYVWESMGSGGGAICDLIFKKVGGTVNDWIRVSYDHNYDVWVAIGVASDDGWLYNLYRAGNVGGLVDGNGDPLLSVDENGHLVGTADIPGLNSAHDCSAATAHVVFS